MTQITLTTSEQSIVDKVDDYHLGMITTVEQWSSQNSGSYNRNGLVASNGPIGEVRYVDVRQSMRNGGGPACLRLRVTLTEAEWAQVNQGNKFSPELYEDLKTWVNAYYRDALSPEDLRDPTLMEESFVALEELTKIMGLGEEFYPFQI